MATATMRVVADRAGVSKTTVSHVLNETRFVSWRDDHADAKERTMNANTMRYLEDGTIELIDIITRVNRERRSYHS